MKKNFIVKATDIVEGELRHLTIFTEAENEEEAKTTGKKEYMEERKRSAEHFIVLKVFDTGEEGFNIDKLHE